MLRLLANDPARPFTVLPMTGRGVVAEEWSGTVLLDRPFVVPAGTALTIVAGARVEAHAPLDFARGAASAVLDIQGHLVIAGTEAAPVELGTNAGAVWEGVVVSGPTGRAELRHVTVSGATVGLRVAGGAEADVSCSRIVGNATGVDYDGGGLTTATFSGTRLANRTVNLSVADTGGLAVFGPGAAEPGRNAFVLGDDPAGAWNVDVTAATLPIRLDGNAWFDTNGTLLGTVALGAIQATIRRVPGAQTSLMPVLEQPPLPCDEVPLPPVRPEAPAEFSFARAIPNPVRAPITVDYVLPGGFLGLAVVDIFDVRGSRVRRLVERFTHPGRHVARWDLDSDRGGQIASGVYFLRFEAAGYSSTRKILVLR